MLGVPSPHGNPLDVALNGFLSFSLVERQDQNRPSHGEVVSDKVLRLDSFSLYWVSLVLIC